MRSTPLIRLCLFDVDGTLVHVAEEVAFAAALRELYGTNVDLSYDLSITISDTAYTEGVLTRHLGRPARAEEVQRALDRFVETLDLLVASQQLPVRTVRGAAAFVRRLSTLCPVALSTGCVEASARLKLRHVGLDEHFACGGFSRGERDRAEIIGRAIEAAQSWQATTYRRRDVILFGDGPWDVESARAAGVRFVGINESLSGREALAAARAEHILPDFTDTDRIQTLIGL